MNLDSKQVKSGVIEVMSFAIEQRNHDQKKMIQKYIQPILKKNLLLLKHLLEPKRIKSTNI